MTTLPKEEQTVIIARLKKVFRPGVIQSAVTEGVTKAETVEAIVDLPATDALAVPAAAGAGAGR